MWRTWTPGGGGVFWYVLGPGHGPGAGAAVYGREADQTNLFLQELARVATHVAEQRRIKKEAAERERRCSRDSTHCVLRAACWTCLIRSLCPPPSSAVRTCTSAKSRDGSSGRRRWSDAARRCVICRVTVSRRIWDVVSLSTRDTSLADRGGHRRAAHLRAPAESQAVDRAERVPPRPSRPVGGARASAGRKVRRGRQHPSHGATEAVQR